VTTAELLGVPVSRLDRAAAVAACAERVATGAGGYACFVNVHTLTESTSDPELHTALAGATYCFADGVPVVWLSRAVGAPVAGRVCGPDFMVDLLERERGRVHGFVGGVPGRAEAIAARFGIDAVIYSPPMRPFAAEHARADWGELVARCPGGRAPAIVWVGLGAPKQERWLHTVSPLAPAAMLFGVGAAFDFLSGAKPRAPRVLQRAGLEWAYRLATEPRRLWRRYLTTNTRFALLAAREVRHARARRSS
jgi:N-acetylglucosaminyldiphosphoundecaprenol N-acetyl-beta-D-mannosaminyltransferase